MLAVDFRSAGSEMDPLNTAASGASGVDSVSEDAGEVRLYPTMGGVAIERTAVLPIVAPLLTRAVTLPDIL